MQTSNLAFVADALLALCTDEPDRPFFNDDQLLAKTRADARRNPTLAALMPKADFDPLLASEYAEVVETAKLTDRQREVLARRLEGQTFDQIGRRSGGSRQGAQKVFVQAIKKIVRSLRVYPYRGLSDVYRREVGRGRRAPGSGTLRRTGA